jgi:hypothetical protein
LVEPNATIIRTAVPLNIGELPNHPGGETARFRGESAEDSAHQPFSIADKRRNGRQAMMRIGKEFRR